MIRSVKQKKKPLKISGFFVVGTVGLEPTTPAL